jgi:signal transduction histidine kinase
MLPILKPKLPCNIFLALSLGLFMSSSGVAVAQDEAPEVLVLHSFRTTNPVNIDWQTGIVKGLASGTNQLIQIDVEAPDLSRFEDAAYMSDIIDIYRRKYRDQQPDLIIPTYTPALKFLLEYGEELFPGVPIVFCAADSGFVAAQQLPSHYTGITTTPDIKGTLELALRIQPDTRRVAVVVGAGVVDRQLEIGARKILTSFEENIEIQWLLALTADELDDTLGKLPDQTVILYLIQNEDRTGNAQVPINVLQRMSNATNSPIYGLWDSLIGHGIVGGRLLTMHDGGIAAGQIALQVLGGKAPSDIPVISGKQNPVIFDGQELVRWRIKEELLPKDSHILNRELSVWDQYAAEITIVGLVVILQALLILALMVNRTRLNRARTALQKESDRRRQAEITALEFRDELDKFSKERFLGAIATTIAHEINQPLIAIQNYAQAAKRRADGEHRFAGKLNELLDKIEGQAGRAGDIIKNVRALVQADEANKHPTSLDLIVVKVLEIVESEREIRKCRIDYVSATEMPEVFADDLQIQLVLVNLLRNAMMSMVSKEHQADKVVNIKIDRFENDQLCVSVTDQGIGIPAERLEAVFEPMYSESRDGMGMGLAICRMIMDAHNGRIWCEPNPPGGTRFHFTLRAG